MEHTAWEGQGLKNILLGLWEIMENKEAAWSGDKSIMEMKRVHRSGGERAQKQLLFIFIIVTAKD